MHAWSHGGEELSKNIPALSDWTQIKIKNIEVRSNEIDLGFTTQGPDGEWLYVDEVKFIPQKSAPKNVPESDAVPVKEEG